MQKQNISKNSETEKFITEHFDEVLKAVTKYVASKSQFDQGTVEDLAEFSTCYVVKPALEGKGSLPESVDHWIGCACKHAQLRIRSEFRRRERSIISYTLDEKVIDDDGNEVAKVDQIGKASLADWVRERRDEEEKEMAKEVYAVRDRIFAELGLTSRAASLFIASELYQRPAAAVERAFDTTRGAIYVNTCRVKRLLRSEGPAIVHRLLKWAA